MYLEKLIEVLKSGQRANYPMAIVDKNGNQLFSFFIDDYPKFKEYLYGINFEEVIKIIPTINYDYDLVIEIWINVGDSDDQ